MYDVQCRTQRVCDQLPDARPSDGRAFPHLAAGWKRQRRSDNASAPGPDIIRAASKSNVARIHVRNVDSHPPKLSKDFLHGGPIALKVLGFFFPPISPYLGRVIRRLVQVRPAKVETIWRLDRGHFNEKQIVVVRKQPRNLVAADFTYIEVLEPKLDADLAVIGNLPAMKFDRENGRATWTLCSENGTLSSSAE